MKAEPGKQHVSNVFSEVKTVKISKPTAMKAERGKEPLAGAFEHQFHLQDLMDGQYFFMCGHYCFMYAIIASCLAIVTPLPLHVRPLLLHLRPLSCKAIITSYKAIHV